MRFLEALNNMKEGIPMKLPSWGGYWSWEADKETIMMHCRPQDADHRQGPVLDIRETQRVEYTLQNILSDEWIPADCENCPVLGGKQKLDFGTALRMVKKYGKGMRLPQWKEDVVIRCALPPDMKDTRAGIARAICTDVCLALNKELTEAQESTIRAAVRNRIGEQMTAPYLYVESRFGRVPWKETMIELFSEEWEIVD